MSVRPTVCPVDRQQHRRPAYLLQMSGAGSRYRSTRGGPRKFRSDCEEVRHTCSVGVCSQFPKSDDNIIFYVPGQVTSGARAKGLNVLYTAHETNRGQQQGPPCPTLQVRAAAAAAVHFSGRAPALRPRDTHHARVRGWVADHPRNVCKFRAAAAVLVRAGPWQPGCGTTPRHNGCQQVADICHSVTPTACAPLSVLKRRRVRLSVRLSVGPRGSARDNSKA